MIRNIELLDGNKFYLFFFQLFSYLFMYFFLYLFWFNQIPERIHSKFTAVKLGKIVNGLWAND